MQKMISILPRWLPALVMMLLIFAFSSQPANSLPDFFSWDYFIKKSGHVLGYALLCLSFLHWFEFDLKKYWLAWLCAILFALTDEYHQTFAAGRHPSIWDVLVFDNIGALIMLGLVKQFRGRHEAA